MRLLKNINASKQYFKLMVYSLVHLNSFFLFKSFAKLGIETQSKLH